MTHTQSSCSYDAFAETFSNSRRNLHWQELDAIIEDMKKHDTKSILDVGCGNGRLYAHIQNAMRNIQNYIGIDSSSRMIEQAKTTYPDGIFRIGNMESLEDFASGTLHFESIVFLASFHHLDTRTKRISTLTDAKQLLAPKGKIFMTNWNLRDQQKYAPMETSDGEFQIKIGPYSRYYHGFTLDELTQLFEETGYRIIENRIFE